MTDSVETTATTTTTTTDTISVVEATPEVLKVESKKDNTDTRRGRRGEVGSHNMKGLFHAFQRREGRKSRGVSLKVFAHQVAESGSEEERNIALKWIANKCGILKKKEREQRQKLKGADLAAIRQASKNKSKK